MPVGVLGLLPVVFDGALRLFLVKVINIDPTGKIRLSRKALLQDEVQKGATPAPAAKE